MSIRNLIFGVNSVTVSYLIRYDSLLQNATAILLQNATEVYYKMRQVFYYKIRHFCYKMRQLGIGLELHDRVKTTCKTFSL